VNKGLIDIQTPEIWLRGKGYPHPAPVNVRATAGYVRAARKRGEASPGFLCVIDCEKGCADGD
jgi:hypothetical protein